MKTFNEIVKYVLEKYAPIGYTKEQLHWCVNIRLLFYDVFCEKKDNHRGD